jgi:hypothetical protein
LGYPKQLAKRADKAMYEFDPDTRFEAALRLAEVDPARASDALSSIAESDEFDPDTRSEAAYRLAEVAPPPAESLRRPAPPAPRPPQAPRPPRPPSALD